MGFILAAWGGPGMITKDFANHSVQLYLSRPISRTEYLFGKSFCSGRFALLHHMDSRSHTCFLSKLSFRDMAGSGRTSGWLDPLSLAV